MDSVRYHYYSFIANSYNRNFQYAYEHVGALRGKANYLNPALKEVWLEENTLQEKVFDAIIRVSKNRKRVRIVDLQQTFDLISGDYASFPENSRQTVVLHFFLNGIKAEIVKVEYEDNSENPGQTAS